MTDTTNEHGKRAARKAPWYASVPGLKILVSPELRQEPITGEEGEPQQARARAVDVSPFELPGGQLRASAGAAARGWYGPRLVGSPSTTRQAEVLNTAVIGNPTGYEGIVNGRDNLSQSMISYDAPTEYNKPEPREISSPNVLVCGTVGYAKSSLTKTVGVARPLGLSFRRAVVFDKKDQGGVGEYTGMANRLGSTPLLFDPAGGGIRLNLLDPMIMRGTGVQGQMELVNAVARIARNDVPATEWEEKATRYALRVMLEQWDQERAVTATDLMPFLGRVPDDEGLTAGSKERFHQAGLSIRFGLENLLETFSGIFEGDTSPEVDLADKLTVFDVSQLPDAGPAVPTVMAVGHQWLLGRLRRERGWITNVIYEEGWHMITGPSARLVKSNQKLSRALGISNWFVMHKGTDIPKGSDGYTVIQEAQTLYAYRQDRPEDAQWVQETFGLAPDTADVLMNLNPGHCIFKYGSNPETHMQHIRSEWEAEVTNTDEGMAGSGAKLQATEAEL